MSRKNSGKGGSGLLVNLGAGEYGPVERAMKILGNFGRKVVRRQMCCGNYGDPGC